MWSVIGCLVLLSFGYFMARKQVFNTTRLCTPGLNQHGITRMPYNHEWQNGHYNTHKNLFRAQDKSFE